jgi:hypothetical protein
VGTCWRPPPDQWDRINALLPRRVRIEMRVLDFLFAEHPWEQRLVVRLRTLQTRFGRKP